MLPRTYSTHQSCFMASSSQNSQSWGSHPINHALSRRQVPSCVRLEPYHIPTGPPHSLPAPSAYAHPPRSLVYPKARCTASHIHSDHTCLQIIMSDSCFKRSSSWAARLPRHQTPRPAPPQTLSQARLLPLPPADMVHTSKQQVALPLSSCRQLPLQICILLSVGLKNAKIRSIGGGLRREE